MLTTDSKATEHLDYRALARIIKSQSRLTNIDDAWDALSYAYLSLDTNRSVPEQAKYLLTTAYYYIVKQRKQLYTSNGKAFRYSTWDDTFHGLCHSTSFSLVEHLISKLSQEAQDLLSSRKWKPSKHGVEVVHINTYVCSEYGHRNLNKATALSLELKQLLHDINLT